MQAHYQAPSHQGPPLASVDEIEAMYGHFRAAFSMHGSRDLTLLNGVSWACGGCVSVPGSNAVTYDCCVASHGSWPGPYAIHVKEIVRRVVNASARRSSCLRVVLRIQCSMTMSQSSLCPRRASPCGGARERPMQCPQCQRENPAGAKFCNQCAAPLLLRALPVPQRIRRVPDSVTSAPRHDYPRLHVWCAAA